MKTCFVFRGVSGRLMNLESAYTKTYTLTPKLWNLIIVEVCQRTSWILVMYWKTEGDSSGCLTTYKSTPK